MISPHDDNCPALEADQVQVCLGGVRILDGLCTRIESGGVTALVGPNGSGKSTLLRSLARLTTPSEGAVYLDGRSIQEMNAKALARELAMLPQSPTAPGDLSVRELVSFGRFPHQGLLQRLAADDRKVIDWAISVTGLETFAQRSVETLSGGERQRAWIAVALAQKTRLLLLDEPTTYLDMRHQLEVLSLVRSLNVEYGLTVVWVLHDLNHAARYSDHLIALRGGEVVAQGHPADVITTDLLRGVFEVDGRIVHDDGYPIVIPMGVASSLALGVGARPLMAEAPVAIT